MKNSKIIFVLAMLHFSVIALAFPADPDNIPGDSDPLDIQAPIDNNILWLLAFGLILAFVYYKKQLQLKH